MERLQMEIQHLEFMLLFQATSCLTLVKQQLNETLGLGLLDN